MKRELTWKNLIEEQEIQLLKRFSRDLMFRLGMEGIEVERISDSLEENESYFNSNYGIVTQPYFYDNDGDRICDFWYGKGGFLRSIPHIEVGYSCVDPEGPTDLFPSGTYTEVEVLWDDDESNYDEVMPELMDLIVENYREVKEYHAKNRL